MAKPRVLPETWDDDEESEEDEVERPKPKPPAPPPPAAYGGGDPSTVSEGGTYHPPAEESSSGVLDPRGQHEANRRQVADMFTPAAQRRAADSIRAPSMQPAQQLTQAAPPSGARVYTFSRKGIKSTSVGADVPTQTTVTSAPPPPTEDAPVDQPQPTVQRQTRQPDVIDAELVPVRRRVNPFALLFGAAALLVGAVAFSMMNDESIREDEPEPEEESKLEDVIEGEIVEDSSEDEEDAA